MHCLHTTFQGLALLCIPECGTIGSFCSKESHVIPQEGKKLRTETRLGHLLKGQINRTLSPSTQVMASGSSQI